MVIGFKQNQTGGLPSSATEPPAEHRGKNSTAPLEKLASLSLSLSLMIHGGSGPQHHDCWIS